MHPVLFTLFGKPVYGFGVCVAVALLVGALWSQARWRYDKERFLNAFLWSAVAAFVGARLLFVAFFPALFWQHPLETLLGSGGLVWYGGVVAFLAAWWLFSRWYHWSFSALCQALSMPTLVGLAIGRLGCLLAGCCYGAPCPADFWGALHYPPGHSTYPVAVYPAPLVESAALLLLVLPVVALAKRQTALTLVGFGMVRFGVEFLRGDRLNWLSLHGPWGALSLSASQCISLAVVLVGLLLLLRRQELAVL